MLVNLVPEFLAIPAAPDPTAAYHDYLDRHKPVLQSYWHNYVLDPTSPHAEQVIAATLRAERADLDRLLEDVDVAAIAEDTLQRILRDCGDVHVLQQPVEIRALGAQRGRDYLFRVRRRRVQHVVVPIALQHGLVTVEILVIGRAGVGRGGDRQELRHEIDEHEAAGPNLGTSPAGDKRAPARGRGATERARLDNLRRDCSRDGAQVWSRILRLISARNRRSAGVRLSMPRAEILSSTRSISACAGSRSTRRGGLGASLARAARPGWTSTLGSLRRRRLRSARPNRQSLTFR